LRKYGRDYDYKIPLHPPFSKGETGINPHSYAKTRIIDEARILPELFPAIRNHRVMSKVSCLCHPGFVEGLDSRLRISGMTDRKRELIHRHYAD
jgi:hypothetical protein